MHPTGPMRHDAVIGTDPLNPTSARLWPRRGVAMGGAVLIGLVLTASCTAPEPGTRRCIDIVGSGQHSHRMVAVPCPAEEPS